MITFSWADECGVCIVIISSTVVCDCAFWKIWI
jgi:hypothetical protein